MPSAAYLHDEIRRLVGLHIDPSVDAATRERITILVLGIIHAESAAPAQIASALQTLGLSGATAENIERRVRRIENDPEITAALCFHPLAKQRLLWSQASHLTLILDPTSQDDRIVMVSVAVWYRGRALPLAWTIWLANTPLVGERFWARIQTLLDLVATLLPQHVQVTWLADRAFGTPVFTDMVVAHGWNYVVRLQRQTLFRDDYTTEQRVDTLVPSRGRRGKRRAQVFKKRGWRSASVVCYWRPTCKEPLCLVSNLAPDWALIHLYRSRYAIEATFRDYKTHGWQWERGQVVNLDHVQRLLIGMALATWIVLFIGTKVADDLLAKEATGQRHTVPWDGKRSLFTLGLQELQCMICGGQAVAVQWQLGRWDAPNWQTQITSHHARAFVFAPVRAR